MTPEGRLVYCNWYTACVTPQLLTQKLNCHTKAINDMQSGSMEKVQLTLHQV